MSYYMSDWEVVCSANNEGATLPRIPENYGAVSEPQPNLNNAPVVITDKPSNQGSKFAAVLCFGAAVWLFCRD